MIPEGPIALGIMSIPEILELGGQWTLPFPRVEQMRVKMPPLIEPALKASLIKPMQPSLSTGSGVFWKV